MLTDSSFWPNHYKEQSEKTKPNSALLVAGICRNLVDDAEPICRLEPSITKIRLSSRIP